MSTNPIPSTTPPRKIRGDSKLAQLNPDQRELIRVWLEDDNETYATVVRFVYHQFGLHLSKSAVGAYYKRHLLPERYDDDTAAAAFLAGLPVGAFDAATVKHAKALAFNALARPVPQIQTASRLLDLVHRVHRREIAEKRLALEHRRVALKEAESAARPPRAQPRSSSSELRSPPPARPPRSPRPSPPTATPAAPETPPDSPRFPAYSSLSQPPAQPETNAAPILPTTALEPSASPVAPASPAPEPLLTAAPPPAPLMPATRYSLLATFRPRTAPAHAHR